MTSLVVGVGYSLGRTAVDVVLLVDRYAGQVSRSLIVLAALVPLARSRVTRWRSRRGTTAEKDEHHVRREADSRTEHASVAVAPSPSEYRPAGDAGSN